MTTPPFPAGPAPSAQPPSPAATALALTLALAPIAVVLLGIPSEFFDLERFAAPKETIVHLTAALVGGAVVARRRTLIENRFDRWLIAVLAWSALLAARAVNPWLGLRAAALTGSTIVLFEAARILAFDARRILLGGAALAVTVGAATAVAQAYGLELGGVLAESRAPGGTFGNRNFMAHVVAIGLPLMITGTAVARGAGVRAGGALALSLAGAALVLSRSRGAWLGSLAALGLLGLAYVVHRRRRHFPEPFLRPRLPALALGVGVAFALVMPNHLAWRSGTPYRDSLRTLMDYREGSGRGRLVQYRNSLTLFLRHPVLGVGPGNWFVHYPTVTTPGDPSFAAADPIPTNPWPSSDVVAWAVERGAPGLALGAIVVFILGLGVVHLASSGAGVRGVVLLATLGAVGVVASFDAVLQNAVPAILVPVVLGALVPSFPQPERTVKWTELATRAMLVLSLAGAVRTGFEWRAIVVMGPGRSPARAAAAVRWDPWNARLHLYLSQWGSCAVRRRHFQTARRLLPFHPAAHAPPCATAP